MILTQSIKVPLGHYLLPESAPLVFALSSMSLSTSVSASCPSPGSDSTSAVHSFQSWSHLSSSPSFVLGFGIRFSRRQHAFPHRLNKREFISHVGMVNAGVSLPDNASCSFSFCFNQLYTRLTVVSDCAIVSLISKDDRHAKS